MKHFKLFFALFAMLALGVGNAWAEEVTANFGWSNWDGVTERFSGDAKDEVTQTVDGVVVTYTRNGASLYANDNALRFYKSNTLKFDAPTGYSIQSIAFTCTSYQTDITSDVGTCTATSSNLSWSGDATSVTFTRPSNASSYATITGATVTLAATSGGSTSDPGTGEGGEDPETPGTGGTVTYTVSSVSAVTTTGNVPQGSTAVLSGTGSLNGDFIQCTNGKNHTLTLTGYEGYMITGVTIHVKSNSSKGTGSFSVMAGSTTIASITESAFNTSSWNGDWNTTGVDKTLTMTNDSYKIQSGENVTLTINCKSGSSNYNSLYVKSYTITYKPVSSSGSGSEETAYSVTVNQPANGTISATGLTDGKAAEGTTVKLTAKPDAGYKWESWTVTGASGNVSVTDNQFTMPAEDVTVTASFVAKRQYTITWNVAEGSVEGTKVYEGDTLGTLPTAPNCSEGKVFVGWTEATSVNPDGSGITYAKATDIPTGDKVYNAVYAVSGGTEDKVDELTQSWTGITGTTYTAWSDQKSNTSAIYSGQSAAGNDAIQLRATSPSGIITTTSGGKIKKIVVTWNSNTSDGRTLDVYGNNSAYSATTDLYSASTDGDKLGSIVKGTSTELEVTGDYAYIGLRSASGAMYLDEVEITWSSTSYIDYSLDCGAHQDPFLTIEETPIDFGTVAQNETVTETLNVSGGYLAEDVALTISGTYASFFSVTPTTIAKADEIDQDVTITYNPTATGDHTATLTIKSGEITKTVALSGTVLAPGKWALVTDASQLNLGDEIIIVAADANVALSTTQNTNNRGQAEIVKVGNTVNAGDDVQILTLGQGTVENTYAFSTGSGYLYAAGTNSNNHLKTKTILDATGSWAITIDNATGVATIKAQDSNTKRNWLRYNATNNPPIFSCYESGQKDVCVYRNTDVIAAPIISGNVDFTTETLVTITAQSGLTVYYTTDDSTPDKTATQYSAPFTINATTTVKAIAYDAADNASAVAEMTFTKHDLVNVATAMALAKDEIAYFDEFEVVKVVAGKSNIYIKDASGHGLIYDLTLAGQLKDGDRVKGFVGVSSPYNGLPEAKPHNVTYEDLTITAGTAAEPYDFTSTAIAETDINKYIAFQNVEITENTDMSTNPTLTIGGNSVKFYNQFDVSKTLEAGKTYDIYGFVAVYEQDENRTLQVYFYEAVQDGEVIQKYTVTYNAGGATGTVPVDNAEYSEGAEVYLKSATGLTYEGYEYKGWKVTDKDGNEISVAENKFNMPASNVTVTALWEEVKTYDQGAWVLVTDAGDLAVNDDVIIAAANDNYALGTTQNNNNRGIGTIVKGSNVALLESFVQILTLENGNKSGTLALSTGKGYLYAASSSSNHLKTETTLSDNSSWTIAINEGLATINAQGENTRNQLQYNSDYTIFSCYSSAQEPVAIYEYNPNERVITFDVNGGEAYAHTYVATTSGTLALPTAVPTHAAEGQLFSSWNDKEDGSGNTYDAGTTYPFTKHTTLYAQWAVADAYHVTYNIAGASGTTPVDANHYYGGENITLAPQGDLVNPGHIFAGWKVVDATDTEITVTDNAFTMPQSDVTATAKWVRKINDKWVLVTSTEQLIVGDKYVIACNTKNAIAGKIVDKYMQHIDATFSEDKSVIVACSEDPQILTLGKEDDLWTFTNESGKYLSDDSKSLKWAEEKNKWTIVIEDEYTAIAVPDHAIYYNSSATRFKTYDIGTTNMSDIQLYRLIPNQVVSGDMTDEDVPQYSNVTVENGGDLSVENSDTQYGDVYINDGGSVEVDDNAQLTVNNLYISTTMGTTTSGQLNTAAEDIIVNGDAFIDITLGKNGDSRQWHAFTVPFPVDAMNGVYDLNDNKLTNEVNYAIMDYHGDLRANGQYGWTKYRGILVPGTFYLMTVDGNRTTYRFKKVKGAELIAPATKELKAYTGSGDATKDHGWNGVGNPTLMHGKVDFDAQILDPEWYIYKTITASSTAHFTVGTPFFIQAKPGDDEVTIASETNGSLALARRAAATVDKVKVMLGNADYTDYLYVSASEDATNEYEIGKDLAKMIMTKTPSVPQIFAEAYNTRLCMIDAPMANNEAVVALNLYAPANGEYTLSIEAQDNEKVYLLHDGTFVWDLSMSEYPITLNKGDNAGYSILVHRADAPTSVETIDGTNNQTEKLIHNGNLYILHNGKVFDAVGTMLK